MRFLIQKQRVRKYRTKHFPCGTVFIIYILRFNSCLSSLMTDQDKTLLRKFKLKAHASIIT